MAELRVPGVAVGLLDGDAESAAGLGVTSVEHPLPVDDRTLFQIGSITKTFVGTALRRQVEAGRLDLDVPVRRYLPDLRLADEATAAGLTLRHLLTHTGGWQGDYFADTGSGDDALQRTVAQLDRLEQVTPLGEVFSYSNSGFYVAGRVLEVATGQPFEAAIQDQVLAPLDLRMTFFRHRGSDFITHRVASGHVAPEAADRPVTVARPYALPRSGAPTGGLVSTVRDLLRYARSYLGDGTAPPGGPESGSGGARLLSAEGLRRMQEPLVPAGWRGPKRGLAWAVWETRGGRQVAHAGTTHGHRAQLPLTPTRRWALVVLTNADRGGPLHERISRWATEHLLGVRPAEDSPPPVPQAPVREWAGRYRAPGAGGELTIAVDAAGRLSLMVVPASGAATSLPARAAEPAPLPPATAVAVAPVAFRVLDGPHGGMDGEVIRDRAGDVRWLRFGGRVLTRQD